MSEAVLFGIAKSILHVLASPALDEFRLLWGQKKHLEKLEGTIATIRDVLHDADRRQASDAAVQGWLTRLRIVLYEADDLFDLISAKVLHENARTGSKIVKEVSRVLSKPHDYAFFVKSAHKVKAIRERLDAIASDIKGFHFLPVQTEKDILPYRIITEPTHSYISTNEVIGREKEREDVVKMLLSGRFQRHMRAVVDLVVVIGIGGLGKTTLAQLVRNDDRVQHGFDLCIWSCINYFSPLKQALVKLIRSATKGNVDQKLDLDTLQFKLREVIEGKRFLLILDDVWDEDPQNWYKLQVLLNFGKVGSMVLATTRSKVVAQSLNATEPYRCYYLKGLSDESAWLLFKKMAFSVEEGKHGQYVEELGRQIVKKCANVPLAIVIIGSLLRHKEKKKWVSLLDDELSKVVPQDYSKIMQILKISYNEFPYPVKSCFAYCSLFPKGYRFEKQRLVRLWIAQGFVESCDGNQNLEEIAEGYFMYLVERCFFQDMEMDTWDGVADCKCRMHDLVHDLAMEVAKLESDSIDITTQKLCSNTISYVSVVTRDSDSFVDVVSSFPHSKNLRTFLLVYRDYMYRVDLKRLISCFKVLRVLDLSGLREKEIPSSIGNLIHLRYLDLSHNPEIETLPSSICSLQHLHSLILEDCWSLKNLPKDLGKLLSLRHLVLRGCDELCWMPPGLASLTSLVTLDKLIVEYPRGGRLENIEWLENLSGCLEIVLVIDDGLKDVVVDVQKSCLSRNRKLEALSIKFRKWPTRVEEDSVEPAATLMDALEPHCRLEYLSICGFGGKKIPAWVTRLSNLVTLKLEGCCVCIELPSLSCLRSLKELSICAMDSMSIIDGSGPNAHEFFLPSLETLTIRDMPNLSSWWLQEPIVLPICPRVYFVQIFNCPKLTTCMPLFPEAGIMELKNVGEDVMWQGIGLASHGKSVLQMLSISDIGGLSKMAEAQIRHLSALEILEIKSCLHLESLSCGGLGYLTSLEELKINECTKLKWVDTGDDQKKNIEVLWGYLSKLKIMEIPNVNMLLHEEEDGIPWKTLEKLEALKIEFQEMKMNKSLLKGVENLVFLQELSLGKCKELHMPWRAVLSLNHLRELTIEDVEKVIEVDYDSSTTMMASQIQLISSNLRGLTIAHGSKEWLPEIPWKFLPSLSALRLISIEDMEALPDEIQHLTALQSLDIWFCERVLSMPSWMSSLSSLKTLHLITISKELKKRYKRGSGKDWPLIQHIPRLHIWHIPRLPKTNQVNLNMSQS